MKRALMKHGMVLFLLGLITGLVIPQLHNPRMGGSAHLEGLLNGIFLPVLGAAPAFSREVGGRISHTEDADETVRKAAGGAYALRANLVTEGGEVLAINVVEGQTKVFMGPQPSAATEVRAGAHVRAVIDDACRTDAGACTASEVTLEQASGISRIEAVKERAGEAHAELDQGKDHPAPAIA